MYATQNITRLKSLDRIVRISCGYSAFSIRAAQIRPSLELQTKIFFIIISDNLKKHRQHKNKLVLSTVYLHRALFFFCKYLHSVCT